MRTALDTGMTYQKDFLWATACLQSRAISHEPRVRKAKDGSSRLNNPKLKTQNLKFGT